MGLGAVLDTVLSFVLIMLILSLAVQALMELIKRFFATKAKTMEALLAAMGESAIQSALVAMKTPPRPDGTTQEAAEKEKQAAEAEKAAAAAATNALTKAQAAKAARTNDDHEAATKQSDAHTANQTYEDERQEADSAQRSASVARMVAGVEKPSALAAWIVNKTKSIRPVGDTSNPALIPWTRGRTNLTPEALKAELVRNAIAVSQALRASCTCRAEPWENAFEAAAVLAKDASAYVQRVGPACVLTQADLNTLDKLTIKDLQSILEYVGTLAPAPVELTELLKRFATAAADDSLLSSLPSVNTAADALDKTALALALKHLGALTPTQAQSLFSEYVLPVREEVETMLRATDSVAEKFGKLLPRDVRERLYDVGRDAEQAKGAVEDWYNSWMEQFSALYEAKLKVWAFWIGLLVVVCLNANALTIYQAISRSSTLRTTLTQGAQVPQIKSSLEELAKQTGPLQMTDIHKYQANIDQIYQLNVVGWHIADAPQTFKQTPAWTGEQISWGVSHFDLVLLHIGGWLLTAVLIGLGAPFWNDLFDALMAVKGKASKPSDGNAKT